MHASRQSSSAVGCIFSVAEHGIGFSSCFVLHELEVSPAAGSFEFRDAGHRVVQSIQLRSQAPQGDFEMIDGVAKPHRGTHELQNPNQARHLEGQECPHLMG